MTPPPTVRFIRIVAAWARVSKHFRVRQEIRQSWLQCIWIRTHWSPTTVDLFHKVYDSTKFVPLFTISIPISCNVHPECRIWRKKLCNLRDTTTNYYVCFAGQTLLSQFPNWHSCDTPNLSGQGVPCGQDISHAYTYLHCKKTHRRTCHLCYSI